MAIMLPGPMIAEARGSVGGTVFSRNRGGAYVKNRVSPVQPVSAFTADVRASIQALSQQWRNLSASRQQAWFEAAEVQTVVNRFNLPITLTGEQLFLRVNQRSYTYFGTFLSDPPTDWVIFGPGVTTLVVDTSPAAITITPTTTQDFFYVRMTPPLTLGIRNYRKYARTLGIFDDLADVLAVYQARFGNLIAGQVGQRVYLELSGYSDLCGQISVPVLVSTLIV